MLTKKEFSYSADNFRAIAIVFVVLSHLTLTNNYLTFFLIDATTWFLFISGYLLFQIESKKKFSYSQYLKKKIKFVIAPYLVFSTFCILIGIYFKQNEILDLSIQNYIAWSLIVGGAINFPMWFIPMIALFFIFSPIFIGITKQKTLIIFLITLIGIILSIYSSRPANNQNPLFSFFHFFGFYVLGILFFKLKPNIKSLDKKSAAAIFTLGLVLFFMTLRNNIDMNTDYPPYISFGSNIGNFNAQIFGKLCLLIAIFIFLEKYYNKPNKFLSYISSISFGIFLFMEFA